MAISALASAVSVQSKLALVPPLLAALLPAVGLLLPLPPFAPSEGAPAELLVAPLPAVLSVASGALPLPQPQSSRAPASEIVRDSVTGAAPSARPGLGPLFIGAEATQAVCHGTSRTGTARGMSRAPSLAP